MFCPHVVGMESLYKYHLKNFYPNGKQLHHDPLVVLFENFLSASDAEEVILQAKDQLVRARVSGAKEVEVSAGRTNDLVWLQHNHSPDIQRICRTVAEVVGLPLALAEAMQVIRYLPGQEYKAHYDAYKQGSQYMEKRGQRLVTALCYLSNVIDGGETEFPKLNIKIRAKQGSLLIFNNTYPNTNDVHVNSLHAGCPVIFGEKWAFNLWFREYTRN